MMVDQEKIFHALKKGNRPVQLSTPDLEVVARPGSGFSLRDIPDGRWAWVGPRDEASRDPGEDLWEARRRDPGLARTSSGQSHIFGGDGVINCVRFDDGAISLQRTVITNERRLKEDQARAEGKDGWLALQEWTRKDAVAPSSKAGIRESANTAVYPFGEHFLVCYEGGRPYLVKKENLETIGPIGKHGPASTSPWFRMAVTPPLIQEIGNGRWSPLLPTTAHPGMTTTAAYFPHFRYTGPERSPQQVEVDSARGIFKPTHRSRLYAVVHDQTSAVPNKRLRLFWRDSAGQQHNATIGWGAHQCMVTRNWFIVMDSGFVVEGYQYRKHRERGVGALNTVLWFIPRDALDAATPGKKVEVYRKVMHDPTIHSYAD